MKWSEIKRTLRATIYSRPPARQPIHHVQAMPVNWGRLLRALVNWGQLVPVGV